MPIVPTTTAPSVAPQQLPDVRAQTPIRFLSEAAIPGEQLERFGQGATRAGDEMLAEQTNQQIATNEAAVKDYDTKLMGGIQGVLYGTPDNPDAGYLALKGKDATDAYDATVAQLQKLPTDLSQGLQNPAQQQLAKSAAALRTQSAMVQAAQHRDQQNLVWQKTASDIRVKTAQEGAPLAFDPVNDTPQANYNADDPQGNSQYQQYLQTVRSETLDQADRMGLPADVAQDAADNAVAKAYALTLGHLIDRKGGAPGDMAAAKQYFDAVKDDLPAETQDKVRSILEAGQKKDQALQLALDVKSQTSNIDEQEKVLDDKFKAGDIDSDVHDAALQKLRADNSQRRGEQGENDKAMIGTVWDIARKGGTITDLSPSQLAYIKDRGLGTNVDAIFKREAKGEPIDDTALFTELMRQMGDNPSQFASVNLLNFAPQLANSHYDYLVKAQATISRGDAKATDPLKVVYQAVKDAGANMQAAGFNLHPAPNTDAADRLDQFQSSLYDALVTAQEGWTQKKLTPVQQRVEARTLTMGMLKDQALSGSGYFGTTFGEQHMPVWKMTPDQRAAPWDVPDADRAAIVRALQRQSMPATEDNIQRAYKAAQGLR